ncbi:MAG: flavodoxin family protein [Deltaproteobacteria bacterium]|nr:MAG: flavodoxin family protein [Deltaproteobacteria bacterium]
MRVVGINGSARKGGNTAMLLRHVFAELENEGIGTELVELAGKRIRGCTACYKCFANKDRRCAVKGDAANDCIGMMDGAEGILLGSPTYFTDVTAEMKALIDRAGMVSRANGNMYRRKAGAAVVAVRRAGAMHAFDTMNHFFLIGEMIIPGSSYWNIGVGREIGDVEKDEEGVATMRILGRNMAWLMKALAAAKGE